MKTLSILALGLLLFPVGTFAASNQDSSTSLIPVVVTGTTCFQPTGDDPAYIDDIETYNKCIDAQEKVSCLAQNTDDISAVWNARSDECNIGCASGYYKAIDGACHDSNTTIATTTAAIATTSAITNTITTNVYVQQYGQTSIPTKTVAPTPSKIVTLPKTVYVPTPATTTETAPIPASPDKEPDPNAYPPVAPLIRVPQTAQQFAVGGILSLIASWFSWV